MLYEPRLSIVSTDGPWLSYEGFVQLAFDNSYNADRHTNESTKPKRRPDIEAEEVATRQ